MVICALRWFFLFAMIAINPVRTQGCTGEGQTCGFQGTAPNFECCRGDNGYFLTCEQNHCVLDMNCGENAGCDNKTCCDPENVCNSKGDCEYTCVNLLGSGCKNEPGFKCCNNASCVAGICLLPTPPPCPIVSIGQSCSAGSACCGFGSRCTGGICQLCIELGTQATCTSNSQCCSGWCRNIGTVNVCSLISNCKGSGASCTTNDECCSKTCRDNDVVLLAKYCL